jgi:triacylglycerol lipase
MPPSVITTPLVLVHGLWDTPRLFQRLEAHLAGRRPELLIPHLPHGLGFPPIERLAQRLGAVIEERYGPDLPIDLLGFSMGGVVARTWLQRLGGHRRTRRFWSVGSPQQGTLLAQLVPRRLLASIADMKLGSRLLRQLNADPGALEPVACSSFYCPADLMVFPGWRAYLPIGPRQALPVWTHRQLITHPRALATLSKALLAP